MRTPGQSAATEDREQSDLIVRSAVPEPAPQVLRPPSSPAGILAMQRTAGNHAVASMLARKNAPKDPSGVTGTAPVGDSAKTDELLAGSLVEKELGIIRAWQSALLMFDKVVSSESDKAAKPDFQKVLVTFFADKVESGLMGMMKAPGVSMPAAVIKALHTEFKRAEGAANSGRIRDFFVAHLAALAGLDQQVTLAKDDFEAAVAQTAAGKEGSDAQITEYWTMRAALLELHANAEARLSWATPQRLFLELSEEWINASTNSIAAGHKVASQVIIRLEPDLTVRDGTIQGDNGQKIAEQLKKNSPDGVDLYSMEVPRKIIQYASNGWPKHVVLLDAQGRLGKKSMMEGDWEGLWRHLQANRLPKVQKVNGD